MQAEDLPSEIWLNIFSYFEGHDLVRIFSHLNFFFDSLLHSTYLRLHLRIGLGESNERLPEWIWSQINRENIYSLKFKSRKPKCLTQFLRWNAPSLTHLSSLAVYVKPSSDYNLQYFIFALDQMPSLNRLLIKYPSVSHSNLNRDSLETLLTAIFSSRFSIRSYAINIRLVDYSLNTSTWTTNRFLQHLSIECMSLDKLLSLLSFTPQLQSLRTWLSRSKNVSFKKISLSHLRKVHLYTWKIPTDQLQIFKGCVPNLEIFRLRGAFDSEDVNYLEENFWRQLMSKIRSFKVNFESGRITDKSRKDFLKDRIQNSCEEKWFSYQENDEDLEAFIRLHS